MYLFIFLVDFVLLMFFTGSLKITYQFVIYNVNIYRILKLGGDLNIFQFKFYVLEREIDVLGK